MLSQPPAARVITNPPLVKVKMGLIGETIRSIQCTGRIKQRAFGQPEVPDNERRQTFEDRDEASDSLRSSKGKIADCARD